MHRFPLTTWLALSALIPVLARPIAADPPTLTADENGSTTVTITSSPLFDMTADVTTGDAGGELRTETYQDARGKLTGHTSHVLGGGFFSEGRMTGTLKGSPKGASVKTKTVSATFIGDELQSEALQVSRGFIDPSGSYEGTVKMRYCDPYIGCKNVGGFPFSHSMGSGAWELKLTLDGQGKSVFGAVSIITSPANPQRRRSFDYNAKGKINLKTGIATVKLISVNADGAPPVKLKVRMTPSSGIDPWTLDEVLQVSGKLLGQKFSVK